MTQVTIDISEDQAHALQQLTPEQLNAAGISGGITTGGVLFGVALGQIVGRCIDAILNGKTDAGIGSSTGDNYEYPHA
jgi:hypothetical protein